MGMRQHGREVGAMADAGRKASAASAESRSDSADRLCEDKEPKLCFLSIIFPDDDRSEWAAVRYTAE